MKKAILIFPILFLLLPFLGRSEDTENTIESIYVLYYNYSFNSPVDIDCDCLGKSIGYYGIVWEPMIDGLEELNDTTFEREPVVGKHGFVY